MQRLFIAAASLALALAFAAAPKAALAQSAAATPTPAPSASPNLPVGVAHETFVVGDYLANPRVYNEASSGNSGLTSYQARFAAEFKVQDMPFMVAFDQIGYAYTHFASTLGACPRPGCVVQIDGTDEYIHQSVERDTDVQGAVGFRIAFPRIYAVAAYLGRSSSFNYPVVYGLGLGFQKLPDEERALSVYFSALYFPDLEGKFTVNNLTTGTTTIYTLTEHVVHYNLGVTVSPFKKAPAFLDLGLVGDNVKAGSADPSSGSHFAGYAGVGLYSK